MLNPSGLISIKERARALGGDVEISGQPNKGTIITAEIPLRKKEEAMLRILIADDHPVVRIGLKGVLAEIPNTEVAGEASTGHEVMDKVQTQDFDIILLDISMPGNGLDVLKELKRLKPEQKVLVLSIYPEEQYAVRALKAGAAGYLTKDAPRMN